MPCAGANRSRHVHLLTWAQVVNHIATRSQSGLRYERRHGHITHPLPGVLHGSRAFMRKHVQGEPCMNTPRRYASQPEPNCLADVDNYHFGCLTHEYKLGLIYCQQPAQYMHKNARIRKVPVLLLGIQSANNEGPCLTNRWTNTQLQNSTSLRGMSRAYTELVS